jgi:hypothetical protein
MGYLNFTILPMRRLNLSVLTPRRRLRNTHADRALHDLRLGFCGLSNIIHLSPLQSPCICVKRKVTFIRSAEIFAGFSTVVCSKLDVSLIERMS